MTETDATGPQKSLQSNASAFFESFYQKHSGNMTCAEGCAACCHTQISVFESEAAAILAGVGALSEDAKQNLKSALEEAAGAEGRVKGSTPDGKMAMPCSFLNKNRCTVYDFRPTICRTQGMSLQYKVSDHKNQIELAVDTCPLNFTKPNSLPNRAEACDLDRLAALQSIAENFYQKNKHAQPDNLKIAEILAPLVNAEGRVELARLAASILRMLKASVHA